MQVCDQSTSSEDLISTKDVATQTDFNPEDDDSDATRIDSSSEGSYTDEYQCDPDYDGEAYHSQPCFNKRGVSYTPPGFKRVHVKRRKVVKENASTDDGGMDA